MAWTSPATAVTGDVITAAFWNVNGRDNLLHLAGSTGVIDLSTVAKHITGDALLIKILGM